MWLIASHHSLGRGVEFGLRQLIFAITLIVNCNAYILRLEHTDIYNVSVEEKEM